VTLDDFILEDCMLEDCMPLAAQLSVPSPLVGEGTGGGCHAAGFFDLRGDDTHSFLPMERFHRTPFLRLLPSPTLPHEGGGSGLGWRHVRRTHDKRAQGCLG
jgi:hypothetical protein